MQAEGRVGPIYATDGAVETARLDKTLATVVTDAHGRYAEASQRGNLYYAHAIVTAPVAYTTAAATGGPLIWNPPSSGINVVPVAIGLGVTTVTTASAAIGITGNTGQTSAPGSTTAIDSSGNCYLGGNAGAAKVYRVGTPTNAGNFLIPFGDLHTGALTTETGILRWVDIGGYLTIPPGSWGAVSASTTASSTVVQVAMLYEEIKV